MHFVFQYTLLGSEASDAVRCSVSSDHDIAYCRMLRALRVCPSFCDVYDLLLLMTLVLWSLCLFVCVYGCFVCLSFSSKTYSSYLSVCFLTSIGSAMWPIATAYHIAWSVYLCIFHVVYGLLLLMTRVLWSVCLFVCVLGWFVCLSFSSKTSSYLSDYFFTCIGSVMRLIATVSHILWSVYPTFVTHINIAHAD